MTLSFDKNAILNNINKSNSFEPIYPGFDVLNNIIILLAGEQLLKLKPFLFIT